MKIDSSEALKAELSRRNKIRAVFGVIQYAVSILIIICAAHVLYQKFIKHDENVSLFGYKPYVVLSGSMEPVFSAGDIVVAKRTDDGKLAAGDIVTFTDESGAVVTHRIMEVIIKDGTRYYRTKGDSNNTDDIGLISAENIKGKYAFKISRGGTLVEKAMTPQGIMVLVFAIALVYIITGKKSDRRTARHSIRKRYEKQNTGRKQE